MWKNEIEKYKYLEFRFKLLYDNFKNINSEKLLIKLEIIR